MPTFISLLRGINVGGHRKIRMADLTGAYEKLGLTNVRTYVQSGNVVFGCAIRSTSKVAALIEQQIQSCFGHDVNVLIRPDPRLDLQSFRTEKFCALSLMIFFF